MTITLSDLSLQIYDELSDTDFSSASILSWLQANLGKLNDLITTTYILDNSNEASPLLNIEEAAVFKLLYFIKYCDLKIRSNLGAAGIEFIELSSDKGTVRRASKTTVAEQYRLYRNTVKEDLDTLVDLYKRNKSLPLSVDGMDTIDGNSFYNYSSFQYYRSRQYFV